MVPESKIGFAVLSGWVTILGIFLMASPLSWYGPSWSYFAQHNEPIVPAGGFGMGVCCAAIGVLQLLSIWRSRVALGIPVLLLEWFCVDDLQGCCCLPKGFSATEG
jgi:hypothetical protein